MKCIIVVLLLCAVIKSQAQTATEKGHACMIQDLKQKGLLEEDFPSPSSTTAGCFLLANIVSSTQDAFYVRFDNKESIKADCVKPKLKKYKLFDYVLLKEVVEMSRQISKEKVDELLTSARNGMKEALDKSAKDCNSDPTWAGVFDEVLGIKNTTLIVLQRDYCMLKSSIDKNLINVGEVEMNPENIDIDNLDCDELIQNHINERIRDMRKYYDEKGITGAKADCVINKFKNGNAFDTVIALDVIERLDISPGLRRENKEELTPRLETVIRSIFSCFF